MNLRDINKSYFQKGNILVWKTSNPYIVVKVFFLNGDMVNGLFFNFRTNRFYWATYSLLRDLTIKKIN
mgnify:FL=1